MDETERALLIAVAKAVLQSARNPYLLSEDIARNASAISVALEAVETKASEQVEAEHIPLNGR